MLMDDQPNSADPNENKVQKSDETPKFQHSQITASESKSKAADQTGSLTEVSTDNTELSSANISPSGLSKKKGKASPAAHDVQNNSNCGSTGAVYGHSPRYVKTDQPRALHTLLTSSTETRTLPEASHLFTSTRGQNSQRTTTVHYEADGSDLCAAILLACLFCHPLDCLLETFRGCNTCMWSLCSSLCGCEPTTLQPLMNITQCCEPCGCLGVRCFLCDCTVCDICLPATECLDLAMEISQMLYH